METSTKPTHKQLTPEFLAKLGNVKKPLTTDDRKLISKLKSQMTKLVSQTELAKTLKNNDLFNIQNGLTSLVKLERENTTLAMWIDENIEGYSELLELDSFKNDCKVLHSLKVFKQLKVALDTYDDTFEVDTYTSLLFGCVWKTYSGYIPDYHKEAEWLYNQT